MSVVYKYGSWWHVGSVRVNGKRHQPYTKLAATTKRSAEREARALQVQQEQHQRIATTATLDDYLQKWLALQQGRPRTLSKDRGLIANYIGPGLGPHPIYNVTPDRILALFMAMRQKTDRHKALSESTLQQVYRILESSLELAVRDGLLATNPALQVPRPKITISTVKGNGKGRRAAEPTGWTRVDRTLGEVRRRLEESSTEEQFQAVGQLCGDCMISLAQAVYDPIRHPAQDGVEPSATDAKRMLDDYLAVELSGSSNASLRRQAKAALDLANDLKHHRTATSRQAAMCFEATVSMVNLILIISRERDQEQGSKRR